VGICEELVSFDFFYVQLLVWPRIFGLIVIHRAGREESILEYFNELCEMSTKQNALRQQNVKCYAAIVS
jgi:hypothetical protein